jgi:hypothetical protein
MLLDSYPDGMVNHQECHASPKKPGDDSSLIPRKPL